MKTTGYTVTIKVYDDTPIEKIETAIEEGLNSMNIGATYEVEETEY